MDRLVFFQKQIERDLYFLVTKSFLDGATVKEVKKIALQTIGKAERCVKEVGVSPDQE